MYEKNLRHDFELYIKCLGLLLPQPRPSLLGAYLQQHPNLPGMLRNPNPFTVKG